MRRAVAWALVALGLVALPGHAFTNEVPSGPMQQAHGHGELIRRAAVGTPFETQVAELARAQWEQDFPGADPAAMGLFDWWRALVAGYDGEEQKKHFLRWYSGLPAWRAATRPLEADWEAAVGYMRSELHAAYQASPSAEIAPLGRALHALQDSYSPAHTDRAADGRIRSMAYYPAHEGHQLIDGRDRILLESGELTPEAGRAVMATRELLEGFARWRKADTRAFGQWVEGYLERHVALAR